MKNKAGKNPGFIPLVYLWTYVFIYELRMPT